MSFLFNKLSHLSVLVGARTDQGFHHNLCAIGKVLVRISFGRNIFSVSPKRRIEPTAPSGRHRVSNPATDRCTHNTHLVNTFSFFLRFFFSALAESLTTLFLVSFCFTFSPTTPLSFVSFLPRLISCASLSFLFQLLRCRLSLLSRVCLMIMMRAHVVDEVSVSMMTCFGREYCRPNTNHRQTAFCFGQPEFSCFCRRFSGGCCCRISYEELMTRCRSSQTY